MRRRHVLLVVVPTYEADEEQAICKLHAIKGTVLATDESALRGHLKALQAEFVDEIEQ